MEFLFLLLLFLTVLFLFDVLIARERPLPRAVKILKKRKKPEIYDLFFFCLGIQLDVFCKKILKMLTFSSSPSFLSTFYQFCKMI